MPLFHEPDIASRLTAHLGRLDYPRELLDVALIAEADDTQTRVAFTATSLPAWMHVITIPNGRLKTKPRALSYALPFCRGDIMGVLDFYKPRTNWLSRCFTVEYVAWFCTVLPGLARLGFTISLGGRGHQHGGESRRRLRPPPPPPDPLGADAGRLFSLAALAAYKGAWEMLRRPLFWDKTSHGVDQPEEEEEDPALPDAVLEPDALTAS